MTYPLSVLDETKVVVLDEADVMIAKKVGKHGKKDPLFNLVKYFLNSNTESIAKRDSFKKIPQFIFVGATMPDSEHLKSKKALPYVRSWLPDIVTIRGSSAHKIHPTSTMTFLKIESGNKLKLLINEITECLNDNNACGKRTFRAIVYVNSVATADILYRQLITLDRTIIDHTRLIEGTDFPHRLVDFQFEWQNHIFIAHKNVHREERIDTFNSFSSSSHGILITTDVTSRGLDFPDVDLVVQYDFATNVVDILHRAGRTGRMGKKGKGT